MDDLYVINKVQYKNCSQIKKMMLIDLNLAEYINNRYSDSKSLKETVYRILNGVDEKPKCHCGNYVNFNVSKNKYSTYCCSKCKNSDPEKIAKGKKTKLLKYGDENYNNMKKNKETCLKKYGVTSFSKTEEFNEKVKKTSLEKYGTEYWLQTDECKKVSKEVKKEKYGNENYNNREKAKITSFEKYGVENTKQWEGAKTKEKETCLRKYGVTSYTKTEEYKEKAKKTSIKHWGVDNCTKSNAWKEKWYSNKDWVKNRTNNIYNKMIENNSFKESKAEKIIYTFLLDNYPDTMYQYKDGRYPFKCDFYIPSKDLFIEYNGFWHHGGHRFDCNNEQDIKKLNMWKNKSSKMYDSAIKTWTIRDVEKYDFAKNNNLNYIVLWYDDFKDLNRIKKMVDMF